MTTNAHVVSTYLQHLRVRNLRPVTVYNRQRALARLTAWLPCPLTEATEQQLKLWQALRFTQIQPEPVRTELSHLRQFYRWCLREEIITKDPTLRLDMPHVVRRLPRPIADRSLAEALTHAIPETAAILALAGFAGLRACEIARLDWAEIGIGDKSPHIRIIDGKGGHGRIVPISTTLAATLAVLPHRRGPVIRRLDGQAGQCPPHRISSRANDYLHELGIPETLHQLRHRFASTAYQACQDIRAVQDLLGHASPTTTAIYAASASAVAIAAVESAGGLAA
jgi:integrase/recombinase XerC